MRNRGRLRVPEAAHFVNWRRRDNRGSCGFLCDLCDLLFKCPLLGGGRFLTPFESPLRTPCIPRLLVEFRRRLRSAEMAAAYPQPHHPVGDDVRRLTICLCPDHVRPTEEVRVSSPRLLQYHVDHLERCAREGDFWSHEQTRVLRNWRLAVGQLGLTTSGDRRGGRVLLQSSKRERSMPPVRPGSEG